MTLLKEKTTEELKNDADKIHDELSNRRNSEEVEKNLKLVGKYFAYRNSYSMPGPNDYWLLYRKVTWINPEGKPCGVSVQTDWDRKVTIETGTLYCLGEEIAAEEWEIAYNNAMSDIRKELVVRYDDE